MKLRRYVLGGLLLGGIAATRMLRRQARSIEVKNRVVLITGGSRGLGLVIARQLAREGARVVICARDEHELFEAADSLSTFTEDFLTIPCDITKAEEVRRMFDEIKTKLGLVEVVINNAGVIQVGPMENMTREDYEHAMQVHFWGPFNVVNEALPHMMKQRQGRIVNISSINGKISLPHLLPYTVSKFALAGFSEGSAAELSRYNIRVTSVYPGLMRTGSPRNVDVKGKHKKEYAWFKISDSVPLVSMSAEAAAAKVIQAMKCGDKILALGMPAKLAIAMEGIAPGLNVSLFGLANKILPNPDGQGFESKKGYESETIISETFGRNSDEAAEQNNEV